MFDLGYEVHKNHLVLISGVHNRLFSNDKYLYISMECPTFTIHIDEFQTI